MLPCQVCAESQCAGLKRVPWHIGRCSWDGGDPRVLPSMIAGGDAECAPVCCPEP